MTGFLRPEVRALLWRWREVLVAAGVVGFGLWISLSPGPFVQGFGWIVAAVGAVFFALALRRARFAQPGSGPGVVTLDEGQITYMGPHYGGAISLKQMTKLSLRRGSDGTSVWVLADPDQVLVVPTNALGAEALFDGFTALPGLAMGGVLAALDRDTPGTVVLWSTRSHVALTP